MKKFMTALCALCLLAGCAPQNGSSASASSVEEEVVEEPVFTMWLKEPGLDFQSVKVMEGFAVCEVTVDSELHGVQHVLLHMERTGYAQQWNGTAYQEDAVIVTKDGLCGIYNYEGEMVYPLNVSVHNTPRAIGITCARIANGDDVSFVFGYGITTNSTAFYFSEDYMTVNETPYATFDYQPYSAINTWPYFAVHNDEFGIVTPSVDENGVLTYNDTFEPYNKGLPGNAIVPVVDDNYIRQGYVVVDNTGNYSHSLINTWGTYQEDTYINGHYLIASGNEMAFVNAEQESQIGWNYYGAKYFSDGYAPVKKTTTWGLIDEEGNEVTDFIFEDITPVVDGKAYVKYEGQWGILDVAGCFENGVQINLQTCYQQNADEEAIGTAQCHVQDLNIRDGAGVGYGTCGNSRDGSIYKVYETAEADGYTWYRIDETHWIPTDGEWVTFTAGA